MVVVWEVVLPWCWLKEETASLSRFDSGVKLEAWKLEELQGGLRLYKKKSFELDPN